MQLDCPFSAGVRFGENVGEPEYVIQDAKLY